MGFVQIELAFEAGIFANRSARASKQRWIDGDLVRFRDGVPAQMGGWQSFIPAGSAVTGAARAMIAWRPNNQVGKYAAIGTSAGAFLYDGDRVDVITPPGFVPGQGGTVIGDGFGSGRFGEGTYGTPRESTGNLIDASNWTFDMFGEALLGCFSSDGLIYEFTVGSDATLVPILGAPTARAIAVSDERHVFAFGADGVPGRVSWSDRENYSSWAPTDTNRAGGYDLQVTQPFQCGHRCRGAIVGWTGAEVFSFTPLSNALVYSYDKIGTNAGAIGPQSVVVTTDPDGESAYWMGRDNFFVFDGYVRVLDCDLHDYVFKDVNLVQGARFHARLNSAFNEVWFWYCSAASDEVDRAVVYNYTNQTWTKASVVRLCWLDAGIFDAPIALDVNNAFYNHETGDTANGATMPSFVQSFPITVGVGQQFADLDQFWPDMEADSHSCTVSFVCREWPGADPTTIGPVVFNVADQIVPLTISTRQFDLRIGGNGGKWELGIPLISIQGGSLR